MLNQLSVFIENNPGSLKSVIDIFSKGGIDITALSLADTRDYGILRLIVDDEKKAVSLAWEAGIAVSLTPVVVAAMSNTPGGLAALLDIIHPENIDIEYMYAFFGKADGRAWSVLRTSDNTRAEQILRQKGITLL